MGGAPAVGNTPGERHTLLNGEFLRGREGAIHGASRGNDGNDVFHLRGRIHPHKGRVLSIQKNRQAVYVSVLWLLRKQHQ